MQIIIGHFQKNRILTEFFICNNDGAGMITNMK